MRATHITAALLLFLTLPPHSADAQQPIDLTFKDGRVWLASRGATVRQILKEWERRSRATIVNGQAVEDDPLTIELDGVPERDALDLVLRNTAGYIAAARQNGSAHDSAIDRIVILPITRRAASDRQPDVAQSSGDASTPDAADPLASLNTLIGLAQAAGSLRPER